MRKRANGVRVHHENGVKWMGWEFTIRKSDGVTVDHEKETMG